MDLFSVYLTLSKTCSNCGNIKKDLTLKERVVNCSACGRKIDRDYNAALNILREGLRIFNKAVHMSNIIIKIKILMDITCLIILYLLMKYFPLE